jgi:uncharacterized protein YlxP (DUF503 family)
VSAFVAFLRIHLHFPEAGSLKAKRSELNAVKAGLHGRLGASVAEVAYQDTWQRSELAAALCAGSASRAEEAADAVQRYLDARFPQGARVDRAIVSWGDVESIR